MNLPDTRREPILAKGWWIGVLVIVAIFLFAMFVGRPLYGMWGDFLDANLWPSK